MESQIKDFSMSNHAQKEVLTFAQACHYSGISRSTMYKHTSARRINYFKPQGKHIYFQRRDLDDFLLQNRHETAEEIIKKAEIEKTKKR